MAPVGFREAAIASVFYVSVVWRFGLIAVWVFGAQYFAGYIVEKSLSVDNLFVFVVIMSTFSVPAEHQQRVLTFGILVALVMRAIFIALGAVLIASFSFMFLIFGLLLVGTAIQLFRHRDQDPDVEENAIVRLTRRVMPVTEMQDDSILEVETSTSLLVILDRPRHHRRRIAAEGAPRPGRPRPRRLAARHQRRPPLT